MNWLDIGILIFLLVIVLRSILRGAIEEFFSLLAWVVAVIAARYLAPMLVPLLPADILQGNFRYIAAFAVIFIAAVILVGSIGYLLKKVAEDAGLSVADRALGGVLGVAKGLVILVVLTLGLGLTAFPRTALWQTSVLAGQLQKTAVSVQPWLPGEMARLIRYR
jgi:membrane protein required for colicin V production